MPTTAAIIIRYIALKTNHLTQIKKILSDLIGLQLSRTTRAADMECLKFGTLFEKINKDEEINIGEISIHIQCPWRLTNDKEIIIGSFDLYEPPNEKDEYDENINYSKINGNLRDITFRKFINENNPRIKTVSIDPYGGLELNFEHCINLIASPYSASKSSDNEFWRILDNRNETIPHIISKSTGITY